MASRLSLARLLSHLGLRAGAFAVRYLFANLNLLCSLGARESLLVRVDGNELHPFGAHRDHAIHGIASASADTDYLYNDSVVVKIIVNFKRHTAASPLILPMYSYADFRPAVNCPEWKSHKKITSINVPCFACKFNKQIVKWKNLPV